MTTVLLVEDDLDLAATLIDYLVLDDIHCDHASNGVAGLNLIETNRYDVLLLDLNLPRMDGITLCQKVRQLGLDTPVLMLTARDQLDDKLEGFQAGTDDYLVKPFEMQELVVRVQALSKRRSGLVRRLRCADLEMNLTTHSLTRSGQAIALSPTGWTLLETLLRASPEVVSRDDLCRVVWGDEWPDSNSLKVHMFKLRKAVDEPFETPLIQTVPGQGFVIRSPSL